MRKIILASSSPRRREILEGAGIPFIVDAANIYEDMRRKLKPSELVKKLALEKAAAVALRHADALVIGADTVVALGNHVWSKPENKKEARMMLRTLSGKTHDIWTGFAIIDAASGKRVNRAVRARITMRKLTDKDIARYVATGEPLDGAGGYKLQARGHVLISKISGDYTNILGLPLTALLEELKKFGVRLPAGRQAFRS